MKFGTTYNLEWSEYLVAIGNVPAQQQSANAVRPMSVEVLCHYFQDSQELQTV